MTQFLKIVLLYNCSLINCVLSLFIIIKLEQSDLYSCYSQNKCIWDKVKLKSGNLANLRSNVDIEVKQLEAENMKKKSDRLSFFNDAT